MISGLEPKHESPSFLFVLHRGAQDRVDPCLILRISAEMFEHIAIQPDADLLLRPRHDESCRGEPVVIHDRRRIRIVAYRRLDFLIRYCVEPRPVNAPAARRSCRFLL